VTHGWPGSVIEQLKIIEPLTNPTAHGGSAEGSYALIGMVKVILLLCEILELIAICLMGNVIVYIDI